MYVSIHFKENGKWMRAEEEYTVKEAERIIKEELLNDESVTDILTQHFDGWHSYLRKRYKKEGKILTKKDK